jgi:hypothetical protein
MTRAPNPFLVVALLVSVFVHLFLFDWAIGLTLKWRLFSTSPGDQLFRIRDLDVHRKPEIPQGEAMWRPQDIISLGPSKEQSAKDTEAQDKEVLLKSEEFITSDVTEEALLEAIEKAIQAESIAKTETKEVEPGPIAESTIAQEVIAVDEALIKERIPDVRPRISANVKRGTATSDFIFFTDKGPSLRPEPTGITGRSGKEEPSAGTPSEKKEMARLAMAEKAATIPGVIAPAPPVVTPEQDIESSDLVDIVTEDYESIQKYPPLDDLLTVRLFTYHRPREEKGYFRLVIEPRKDRTDFKPIPKDILFVVDSSKSITQKKLDGYAEGLKRCVRLLRPQDRFNIIEFKDFTRKLSEEDVVAATPETMSEGEAFLSGLVSEGGTNVYKSLTELVTRKPTPGRPQIIFLVSDGRPTAGIRKDSEIINQVTELNNHNASIFTFAGGEKINTALLDLLSYRNRGAGTFESDDRKIADTLVAFYREFDFPILVNPRFNFGSIDSGEIYPRILPDLYLNGRLEMYGRFIGEDEFSMQLLGETDGQTKEYVLQQRLTGRDTGDESVARMWAFRKIYYLVGQMVLKGGAPSILAEIQQLSADYKVETSYYR